MVTSWHHMTYEMEVRSRVVKEIKLSSSRSKREIQQTYINIHTNTNTLININIDIININIKYININY